MKLSRELAAGIWFLGGITFITSSVGVGWFGPLWLVLPGFAIMLFAFLAGEAPPGRAKRALACAIWGSAAMIGLLLRAQATGVLITATASLVVFLVGSALYWRILPARLQGQPHRALAVATLLSAVGLPVLMLTERSGSLIHVPRTRDPRLNGTWEGPKRNSDVVWSTTFHPDGTAESRNGRFTWGTSNGTIYVKVRGVHGYDGNKARYSLSEDGQHLRLDIDHPTWALYSYRMSKATRPPARESSVAVSEGFRADRPPLP